MFYRKYRFQVLAAYNQWLTAQFGDLAAVNQRYDETQYYPGQFQFPYDAPLYRLPFAQDSVKETDWLAFKKKAPWTWICLPSSHARWQGFLNERYANLAELNRSHGTQYERLESIRLPWTQPSHPGQQTDWDAFVAKVWPQHLVAADHSLITPQRLWTEYLQRRYQNNLNQLNKTHQATYADFSDTPIPYGAVDRTDFAAHKSTWRREFITGNYVTVFDFIVLHGRAGVNTLILVLGTILLQLTINPYAPTRSPALASKTAYLSCSSASPPCPSRPRWR